MSLFNGGDLREFLESQLTYARAAVEKEPADQILFDPKSVTERLVEAFAPEPIVFAFDDIERLPGQERVSDQTDPWGGTTSLRQTAVEFRLPFKGDRRLLYLRASRWSNGGVIAELVHGGEAVSLEIVSQTTEGISTALSSRLAALKKMATWVNEDIGQWNPRLLTAVLEAVDARKKAVESARQIDEELTIPMKTVASGMKIEIPVKPTAIPMPRTGSSTLHDPEFALSDSIASDVIERITSFGRAVERLPLTASRFSEPELRDILLFVLNSNYEGAVRGEVFNGKGKTDILLTWRDRNAFIGECKIWSGDSDFQKAIDQLLGYVVWRDARAALVIFIKGMKSPSEIITKAVARIESHENWKLSRGVEDPDGPRHYLFTSPRDPDKSLTLTFIPFVIST